MANPAMNERIAARILSGLEYVGVIGIELFEMPDGRLLVNEFAPRVHNSGHWTQDGCEVDQFEQHIRAVAGWPLAVVTTMTLATAVPGAAPAMASAHSKA